MKKYLVLLAMIVAVACSVSSINTAEPAMVITGGTYEDTLRYLYSLPKEKWPAPTVDNGVQWEELGVIPPSPLEPYIDSLKHIILLGKMLFFEPRLSSSNQISCGTCHAPDLSWADGRAKSVGHNMSPNTRNSPTILNVWYQKELFWDGRSKSLEDQAFSPINSQIEMHSDMGEMIVKLRRIKGYKPYFDSAFGTRGITPETVTEALATFEKTLVSRKSAFDHFLQGKRNALSNEALRGLHLFRTKARCMNCHHGPLFTDRDFHNLGLTYYQRKHEDLGRYHVTKDPADVGKFRTPSLRDVMRTRPWMHNGLFDDMDGIMNMYNAGMPQPKGTEEQRKDPMFPKTDTLLKKLNLTLQERKDLVAFMEAITATTYRMPAPKLPELKQGLE